ncbi:Na+/H+ antiporter NhaA [Oscillochloris sp. ZM17-4]|uniref:Na+/H+ antiporter NhaA n=1 Tax=Oscillochloris sp. ZM17-4 TaxID=2866714 RepID=UPI001C738FDB|nr:Na+/H+ antiporter NhaA [Oscillochloris sp. ZM17-4]MBX0329738.1 Na+/H+ antiporter NhaA [Oscillochloris sp. ZM17-4]
MAQPRTPASHWSETSLARMFGPIQHFITQSQSGAIMLFVMTLAALGLANSPLAGAYQAMLELHVGVTIGPWELEESVLHWINDGLMAIFFFVVGLEIKRELLVGELANPRAAALPIIAATGGALVPAGIYALANMGGAGAAGWGVPMATDIAFALGCLALLGSRIPFALKIFVTAVAIVDDLIAVLVIAIFYSADLNMLALGVGLAVLALLAIFNWQGIRSPLVYSVLGVIVWLAFLESGVHATIAGVLIALTIPARYRIDGVTFRQRAHALLHTFDPSDEPQAQMLTDDRQQHAVLALEDLCEQVQAPLQKLEHQLQGWVTWLIMPVFALANAGIALDSVRLDLESLPMVLGVVVGLVLGKPIGLLGATWLAVRSGVAVLPHGITWGAMAGAGVLAGIGFTMSIFIATLAFSAPDALATIKLAILVASLLAGTLGVLLLRRMPAQAAA